MNEKELEGETVNRNMIENDVEDKIEVEIANENGARRFEKELEEPPYPFLQAKDIPEIH